MSILTYPLGFLGGGGEDFYNGVIENSIKFESIASNDYLDHVMTSESTGGKETFTLSMWHKRGVLSSMQVIMGSSPGSNHSDFYLNANDQLYFEWNNAGWSGASPNSAGTSVFKFRDTNAWYHIVFVWDSNNNIQADRSRLYVNGERSAFTINSGHSQGDDSGFFALGATNNRRLGGYYYPTTQSALHLSGHLTDVYGIDSYALGPENFGEYKNGVWIPKEYAGPPPLITDSSDSNHSIDKKYGANTFVTLNYDNYYLGNSSIKFSGRNTGTAVKDVLTVTPSSNQFNFGTDNFTVDFWYYQTSKSHSAYNHFLAYQEPDDYGSFIWQFRQAENKNTLYIKGDNPGTGTNIVGIASTVNATASFYNQWINLSASRDGSLFSFYEQGKLIGKTNTAVTLGSNSIFYLAIGGAPGAGTSEALGGWMDEIRIIKGEAQPPRFYFGTNYGDQAGGRLPQRATTADRFVDDERTVLLLSGQSANNHARAVSLVDESGFHKDNVHFSNSILSMYPTQDGVGRQFAISASQHTKRESFIGNNSSVLINDGNAAYLRVTGTPALALGDQAWQVETWWMTNDATTSNQVIMSGDDHHWGLLYKYSGGTGDVPDILLDLGTGSSWAVANERRFGTGVIKSNTWHHVVLNWNKTHYKTYVDGALLDSFASTTAIATADTKFLMGTWGNENGTVGSFGSSGTHYHNETRLTAGTFDTPQIKWTHTQTAGAGNKDAYDASGWRAHGHEFTDDNATSLLIHGDAYNTTSDAAVGVFKDSSSANSIHHALVSGGGSHHSKAVTLKSDGTNGTSTTDPVGNTIYWCGSNSTVTFANSSSFDYGNTAISTANSIIYAGTSTSSHLADFKFLHDNTSDWTISAWMRIPNVSAAQTGIMGTSGGSSGNHGIYWAQNPSSAAYNLEFFISRGVGGNGVYYYADMGWDTAGPNLPDGWHHVVLTYDASASYDATKMDIYINGIKKTMVRTFQNGSSFGPASTSNHTESLRIGSYNNSTAFDGYWDEIRIEKTIFAPRFYLGNQTPESGGSLTAFKYAYLDGTAEYYKKDVNDWQVGDDRGTIFIWHNPDDSNNGGTLFSTSKNGTNNFFTMSIAAGNVISFQTDTSGTDYVSLTAHRNCAPGRWNSYCLRSDGTGYTLYVDGEETPTTTAGAVAQGTWLNATTDRENIAIGALVRASAGTFFDGKIAQVAVWGGSSGTDGVLTNAQIKAIHDLGPSADLTTSYNSNLDGYWNFTKTTQGTSTHSTFYDQSSGSDDDLTGVAVDSADIVTAYTPSLSAKRLSLGATEYSSSSTTAFGNNHYANVVAESVTAGNFGGFVDDEYTVLLLRGGGADESLIFTDGGVAAGETITFPAHSYSYGKSRVAKTLTALAGSADYELTNDLGLHGSSLQFDGTDSIQVVESGTLGDDFWFEYGDFCVEAWIRSTDSTTAYAWGQSDAGETASLGAMRMSVSGSGADVGMLVRGGGEGGTVAVSLGSPSSFSLNTWYHVAIQRNKTVLQTFINGKCMIFSDHTAVAGWNGVHQKSTAKFCIGSWGEIANNRWIGQIDEFRVTKGIARYTPAGELQSGIVPDGSVGYAGSTGTEIPSTPYLRPTPFVAADGGRGYFANSSMELWIKSDTYPGDTTFTDYVGSIGGSAKTLSSKDHTAAARPTLQTGTGDYALSGGSDAMLFDGSNDLIIIPKHSDINVGGDDFTIEFWGNATWTQSNKGIIAAANSTDTKGILIRTDGGNGKIQCFMSNSSWGPGITTADALTNDVWSHIAVQRYAERTQIFINGVSVVSGTEGVGTNVTDYDYYIGRSYEDSTSYAFAGYLDEIRISKMARYTGQGLLDSAYPSPSTEFGIQTEGSTYGRFDTQVTAGTEYKRYNYQHIDWKYETFSSSYAHAGDITSSGTGTSHAYRQSDDRGTILAWIAPSAASGDDRIFSVSNLDSGTYDALSFGTDSGRLTLKYVTAGSQTIYQVPADRLGDFGIKPPLNEWHLVGVQSSGTAWTLWLDGIELTAAALTSGSPNDGRWFSDVTGIDNIVIGDWFRNGGQLGDYYTGKMSAIGVWGGSSGTTGVLTQAQIAGIYELGPGGDWTTSYSTALVDYWTFGNKSTEGTDTTSAIYSQVSGGRDLTAVNFSAFANDTKLLIHSNEDIDGDTSIVDSSPSAHLIDRVVNDPKYANTGANRSSLAGASYNGIFFDRSPDYLSMMKAGDSPAFDVQAASGNTEDYTLAFWYRATAFLDNAGWFGVGVDNAGLFIRGNGTSNVLLQENNVTKINVAHGMSVDTWYHIALIRSGAGSNNTTLYKNGTSLGTAQCDRAFDSGTDAISKYDVRLNWYYGSPYYGDAYFDQVMFIRGSALSSTNLGHLAHANANTGFGTLGGLILHEEYSDGTNTANAASTFLLHSNNATHHTQGSRKFYNDTANTRFTGTTGHEHAGYFTVGVSGTAFTVLGAHQTGYSPAMTQPSLRLRRGYSYIFAASSLGSHKFYFANSTANSTGYAYGSDASTNKHITGMYVSDTQPTAANKGSLTWTAMTSSHYLGSTDSNGFTYLKYEVPTDAPKDLYYRCGVPHGAMGNAVFVMEATEPAPIKVGKLPALKTSSWNDRDYAGIGTNKSVIHFDGTNYLSTPDHDNWDFATGDFTVQAWFNTNTLGNEQGIIAHDVDGTWGGVGWDIHFKATNKIVATITPEGGGGGAEINWVTACEVNRWYHVVFTRIGANMYGYQNGKLEVTSNVGGSYDLDTVAAELRIGSMYGYTSGTRLWNGFIDEVSVWKGVGFTANTVIEKYQTGRAGNYNTANSACVLHVKADSTYGDTAFTDASPSAHTITNVGGVYHHIDDNRTANTALYFDGNSEIILPLTADFTVGAGDDFTIECWYKTEFTTAAYMGLISAAADADNANSWGLILATGSIMIFGITSGSSVGYGTDQNASAAAEIFDNIWHHLAYVRYNEIGYIVLDGVVMNSAASTTDTTSTSNMCIGRWRQTHGTYMYKGWMDGIRITKGMPRYTSGIPVDGQTPHKQYDDGRSSNVSSNTWATSSTRRYYGINTYTYLQTSEYATNANTVLMIRGDDAETANDGVNMYGENGFHLEFKEVGAGTERDYNNFNTGAAGLGSDTSSTGEFTDEGTSLLVNSRPNQANGSQMFVNEMDQSTGTAEGNISHRTTSVIFGADSNTANVSIASGGTRTY